MVLEWLARQMGVTSAAAVELPVYALVLLVCFAFHWLAYAIVLWLLALRSRSRYSFAFLSCLAFLLGIAVPVNVYAVPRSFAELVLSSYFLLPAAVFWAGLRGFEAKAGQALALAAYSLLVCLLATIAFLLLVRISLGALP